MDLSPLLFQHGYPTLGVIRISRTTSSLIQFLVHLMVAMPMSGSPRLTRQRRRSLTKKFPSMREDKNRRPSVHRLIPDSCALKTKTAPLTIIWFLSLSFKRRITRRIMPSLAAWTSLKASTVVSTMPKKGCALGYCKLLLHRGFCIFR